ncbi:MAG: hypothetical protein M3478_03890, partial [Planctomycetota bacterium]|nr:hypothetical protein [Planctomycetota bacterium]
WAVRTAMTLAGLHLLLVCIAFAIALTTVVSRGLWRQAPFVWLPLGAFLIFAIALAQLQYHLARSFNSIRRTPAEVYRGFEPLPATPVVQPAFASGDADDRAREG